MDTEPPVTGRSDARTGRSCPMRDIDEGDVAVIMTHGRAAHSLLEDDYWDTLNSVLHNARVPLRADSEHGLRRPDCKTVRSSCRTGSQPGRSKLGCDVTARTSHTRTRWTEGALHASLKDEPLCIEIHHMHMASASLATDILRKLQRILLALDHRVVEDLAHAAEEPF